MGGNWAELLEDLLVGIANRIPVLEDFVAFGGVCRSWRSVAIKQNFKGSQQIPWLMLSEEEEDTNASDERRFVSLTKGGMIRKMALPEAKGRRCLESLGWFVTVSEDGEMNLLHPFTRVEIPLPHINTFKYYIKDSLINNFVFIRKAVLSSSPDSMGKNNDYVLMVSYGNYGWMGFWRPGDKTWTTIDTRIGTFYDISYYNGNFYGVDLGGRIFACDIGGPNETVAQVVGNIPREFLGTLRPYLVESEGALLIVVRDEFQLDFLGDYGDDPNFDPDNVDESRVDYGAEEFRIFEVDLNNGGGWREKKSLGNNALFLGDNASISLSMPRNFQGLKPIVSITLMTVGTCNNVSNEEGAKIWVSTTWKMKAGCLFTKGSLLVIFVRLSGSTHLCVVLVISRAVSSWLFCFYWVSSVLCTFFKL